MSQSISTPKKLKLATDQGPLKDTVRSSLVLKDEDSWGGKELLLIQMPSNVNISQLNGQEVFLEGDHTSTLKLESVDTGKTSKKRSYEVQVQSLEGTDTKTSLLVPTSKPGRLKAGPTLSKCVRLQQVVEVPPVVLPPCREEEECNMEMPTGLKQRWKPYGYRKPVGQDAEMKMVKGNSKHKTKKKMRKH